MRGNEIVRIIIYFTIEKYKGVADARSLIQVLHFRSSSLLRPDWHIFANFVYDPIQDGGLLNSCHNERRVRGTRADHPKADDARQLPESFVVCVLSYHF